MQVELLRDIIDIAKNESDEKTRVGVFCVHAEAYDDYVPIIIEIFFNQNIKEIASDEFYIKKLDTDFLIIDNYHNQDFFTHDELELFIDLWHETFIVPVNVIRISEEEMARILEKE